MTRIALPQPRQSLAELPLQTCRLGKISQQSSTGMGLAWATTPRPPAPTTIFGRDPVAFTSKVPSATDDRNPQQVPSFQIRSHFHIPARAHHAASTEGPALAFRFFDRFEPIIYDLLKPACDSLDITRRKRISNRPSRLHVKVDR